MNEIFQTNIGTHHEPAEVKILHISRVTDYPHTENRTTFRALVRVVTPSRLAGDYILSGPCGNWAYAYHADTKKAADCFCIGLGWWELDALYRDLPEEKRSERTWNGMALEETPAGLC